MRLITSLNTAQQVADAVDRYIQQNKASKMSGIVHSTDSLCWL